MNKDIIKIYTTKTINLLFFTTLSMVLMDNIPNTNDVTNATNNASGLKFTLVFIIPKTSQTAEPIIMGILIRKENSQAFCFSTPFIIPTAIVEPLLLMPGSIATPCINPINKACFLPSGLFLVLIKSATTSKIVHHKACLLNY